MRASSAFLLLAALLAPTTSSAQTAAPPPPPPGWTGSASAGLALTAGNSDTSTVNAAYELKRDTGGNFVFKSSGLFVTGTSEGELTTDRIAFDGRLERLLSARTAVFVQAQYLHDSFKSIDYLISPTIGLSRQLWKNDRTEFGVDGAVGVVWEQNPGDEVQLDGAVTAGQQLSHKLTATTEVKEKAAALWKMDDFGDALYTVGISIAASITTATQLKAEFLDTFKSRPPTNDVDKNDIAVLVSFVFKFD